MNSSPRRGCRAPDACLPAFSEVRRGRAVNPLAPSHLTPYVDRTTPLIGPIDLRCPETAAEQLPELVRGVSSLVVPAQDEAGPQAPGIRVGMPTAPHDRELAGRARVGSRVGTRQNMATCNAFDIAGKSARSRRTFLVWYRPGWPPPAPQT